MNNIERLSSIKLKMDSVGREISNIEDILTQSTGPQDTLIAELNMLKDVKSFYQQQLKDNDSN